MKIDPRIIATTGVLGIVAVAQPVSADHAWSTYHWETVGGTAIPLVVDNTSPDWKPRIYLAVSDWNSSPNIDSAFNPVGTNTSRRCAMSEGTIQVCNDSYGYNGWLGIASISVKGGHIVAGSTKLNDSYFNLSTYNTESWKQLVACQEIGHDYGLAHQNENFNTDETNSCMEYTSDPTNNTQPDAHDFEQLAIIYHGGDGSAPPPPPDTGDGPGSGNGRGGKKKVGIEVGNTQAEWGRAVGFDAHGRPNVFQQTIREYTVITHVTWAPDAVRNTAPGNPNHADSHEH